jgi:hypothetical protein
VIVDQHGVLAHNPTFIGLANRRSRDRHLQSCTAKTETRRLLDLVAAWEIFIGTLP